MSEMTLDQVRDWHLKRSKDLMKYAVDPMKLRSANLHRKSADVINAEIKRRDALRDEQFLHAIVSITAILDGKDTGAGVCNEPWQSVRMRLIDLVKLQASVQDVLKDAMIGRFVLKYAAWIRDGNDTLMEIRFPGHVDLSSVGTRRDAIENAMAKESTHD